MSECKNPESFGGHIPEAPLSYVKMKIGRPSPCLGFIAPPPGRSTHVDRGGGCSGLVSQNRFGAYTVESGSSEDCSPTAICCEDPSVVTDTIFGDGVSMELGASRAASV